MRRARPASVGFAAKGARWAGGVVAGLVLGASLGASPARAELSDGDLFWGEVAQPGFTRYRKLLTQARAHLEAEPARPAQAIPFLKRAVELLPHRPEAQLDLGSALYELHAYADAVKHLLNADRLGVEPSRRRPLWEHVGLCRSALGHFAEALAAYDRTIALLRGGASTRVTPPSGGRLDKEEAVLQGNAGEALMALGRLDESVARYRRAVRLNSGYAAAWYALGVALARQERYLEGREAMQEGLRLDPQGRSLAGPEFYFYPAADEHFFLGMRDLLKERHLDAARRFRRYLEVAPASPYGPQARVLLEQALHPPPPVAPATPPPRKRTGRR